MPEPEIRKIAEEYAYRGYLLRMEYRLGAGDVLLRVQDLHGEGIILGTRRHGFDKAQALQDFMRHVDREVEE